MLTVTLTEIKANKMYTSVWEYRWVYILVDWRKGAYRGS